VPFPGAELQERSDLSVVSIYGTRDGLLAPEDAQAAAAELPEDTSFTAIEGGNHGQFGWYGDQSGDNPAELSRADQQAAIVAAAVDLLRHISREDKATE
jgi:pimeloyl-ACP methyl ester carboxylesterase